MFKTVVIGFFSFHRKIARFDFYWNLQKIGSLIFKISGFTWNSILKQMLNECLWITVNKNVLLPDSQTKWRRWSSDETHAVIPMSKTCFVCHFPEKITFTNAPSPQEFTEGDNANIVCDVISSPSPTILWKYKGAKIQMEKDGKSSLNSMRIIFLFHLIWWLAPVVCSNFLIFWSC